MPSYLGQSLPETSETGKKAYQNFPTHAFEFWGAPVYETSNGELACPGFTGATYAANPWDTVKLAGKPLPGICEIEIKKNRDVDKKKAAGSDGARITLHGMEPGAATIKVTIWTPEQLRVFQSMWTEFFPGDNKRPPKYPKGKPYPPALDISHPACNMHNVRSVVIVGGDGPTPGSVPKTRVFTIHALEYLAPGKESATSSPVQPIGSIYEPGPQPLASSYPANVSPKNIPTGSDS